MHVIELFLNDCNNSDDYFWVYFEGVSSVNFKIDLNIIFCDVELSIVRIYICTNIIINAANKYCLFVFNKLRNHYINL